jgi:hypothetical protein
MEENDRVKENDDNIDTGMVVGIVVGVIAFVAIWLIFFSGNSNNSTIQPQPQPQSQVRIQSQSSIADNPIIKTPQESKEEYISSTKKVGNRKDAIYRKEFLKNPDKFTGTRINIIGKIMSIEEKDGTTAIQMYVDDNFNTVIVGYPGSVKAYENDIVAVYGEGAGSIDGSNRMGASMSWPAIKAKYVTVKRHAEE